MHEYPDLSLGSAIILSNSWSSSRSLPPNTPNTPSRITKQISLIIWIWKPRIYKPSANYKCISVYLFLLTHVVYFLYALSNILLICCVMWPPPALYLEEKKYYCVKYLRQFYPLITNLLSTSVSKGLTFIAWNFCSVSYIFFAFSANSGLHEKKKIFKNLR